MSEGHRALVNLIASLSSIPSFGLSVSKEVAGASSSATRLHFAKHRHMLRLLLSDGLMEVWWVAAARAAPVLAVTARWTVKKSQGPGCGGSGRCSRRHTTTARRQPSGAPPSCGTGWGPAYLPGACPHRSCWSCSSSCRRPSCTLTRLASWRSLSNRAASAEPDNN